MAASLLQLKKNQTYWLFVKCIKLKQITVKGNFKLLNEIRKMKVSYKLDTAIKFYMYYFVSYYDD